MWIPSLPSRWHPSFLLFFSWISEWCDCTFSTFSRIPSADPFFLPLECKKFPFLHGAAATFFQKISLFSLNGPPFFPFPHAQKNPSRTSFFSRSFSSSSRLPFSAFSRAKLFENSSSPFSQAPLHSMQPTNPSFLFFSPFYYYYYFMWLPQLPDLSICLLLLLLFLFFSFLVNKIRK